MTDILNRHMNQYSHSPCSPCQGVKDGKLSPDPKCYICPQCDQDFKIQCLFFLTGNNLMISQDNPMLKIYRAPFFQLKSVDTVDSRYLELTYLE